jgi:hypothetical protein
MFASIVLEADPPRPMSWRSLSRFDPTSDVLLSPRRHPSPVPPGERATVTLRSMLAACAVAHLRKRRCDPRGQSHRSLVLFKVECAKYSERLSSCLPLRIANPQLDVSMRLRPRHRHMLHPSPDVRSAIPRVNEVRGPIVAADSARLRSA